MCMGDIVVDGGGELHLYGMCAGNIEVLQNGALVIYGMCTGHVTNSGGRVEISGMVVGNVEKKGGTTTVHLRPRRYGAVMARAVLRTLDPLPR